MFYILLFSTLNQNHECSAFLYQTILKKVFLNELNS